MALFEYRPELAFCVFAVWMFFLITGKIQFSRIKKRTESLVLTSFPAWRSRHPDASLHEFYEEIYPLWCKMIKQTAWYIPHQSEMWPIPASPTHVKNRMRFTSDWIERMLFQERQKDI